MLSVLRPFGLSGSLPCCNKCLGEEEMYMIEPGQDHLPGPFGNWTVPRNILFNRGKCKDHVGSVKNWSSPSISPELQNHPATRSRCRGFMPSVGIPRSLQKTQRWQRTNHKSL